MARDPHIPLFLWVATAVLVHLAGGGGANEAAHVLSERLEVRRFAQAVRAHVRAQVKPIEVALLEEETRDAPEHEVGPEDTDAADQVEPEHAADESQAREHDKSLPDPQKPLEEDAKPEREPEPPAEKPLPPEEKKEEAAEEKPKEDLPVVQLQNRIAVQQHVEDENQQDNPDAEFIGDHANRVKEQTQARITSTDQNDPDPTPGNAHAGPTPTPGNAHVSDVAHSEDVDGDPDKAPSQQAASQERQATHAPRPAETKGGGNPNADARDAKLEQKAGRSDGASRGDPKAVPAPAQQKQEAVAASRAVEAVDEVHASREGATGVGPAREAQAAQAGRAAQPRRLPPRKGQNDPLDFLGLGASGRSRGGINLNLSQEQAVATVGQDQLAREALADGERRRSKHRGSWKTLGIERWRAAIENYNSSVKPGNQTALNTARVPFASYLNTIHSRLHPIFADSFLASLDGLPREHPLSRRDLKTNLEIVLDQHEGRVVRMGVTRSSGSTVFDIAALESVQSASPYGKAPGIIASNDGNVYLHWEFHRDPYYACSTYFARPYIIDVKQESAPPKIPTPSVPPFRPTEQHREGHLHHPMILDFGHAPGRHATR
jgi:hypothetical protein